MPSEVGLLPSPVHKHRPTRGAGVIFRRLCCPGVAGALAVLISTGTMAELATRQEMDNVAQNWLSETVSRTGHWAGSTDPSIREIGEVVKDGVMLARIYNLDPDGFVVVPVMMELPPVKMYSETGALNATDTAGPVRMLRDLFHNWYLYLNNPCSNMSTSVHREEWRNFALPTREFRRDQTLSTMELGPLLRSSWHQGFPYNLYCPEGQSGATAVGCNATAIAQILHFWQWPLQGFSNSQLTWSGDHSCDGTPTAPQTLSVDFSDGYEWIQMSDSCDGPNGCDSSEQAALAELNYEVGVALHTRFGSCGSWTTIAPALFALPYFFCLDWSISLECRKDHDLDSWFQIIKQEIGAARPTAYSIYGHEIVCDGYRNYGSTFEFHMNYGWSGYGNAWYVLDQLYCQSMPGYKCPAMVENMVVRLRPETSPHLAYKGCFIKESMGDGDGYADPGESISLYLLVQNLGWEVRGLQATISSSDPYLVISSPAVDFEPTLSRGQIDTASVPAIVNIRPSCPGSHLARLSVRLLEDGDFEWDYPVVLRVGDIRGFEDNMESGEGLWIHRPGAEPYIDQWHQDTYRCQSGATSWKAGSSGPTGYSDASDGALITPPIRLAPRSRLRFWHRMSAEAGSTPDSAWDGGIVMVSTDGVGWAKIHPIGNYPFTTSEIESDLNFAGTDGLYSGIYEWTEAIFDLSDWNGEISIMFRFGSDGLFTDEGWYVDDVWVGNTPSGFDVDVLVVDGFNLRMNSVSKQGSTWAVVSPTGPALPPGYSGVPAGAPVSYELITTAELSDVCLATIEYSPSEIRGDGAGLRMMKYNGGTWTDITLYPDTTHKTVVGLLGSLGMVALAEPATCCSLHVGDANGQSGDDPTISDISILIDAKFITGTCDGRLNCLPEADVNQSGGYNPTCNDVTISDISTLVDYLFITGHDLGLADCL